MTWKLSSSPCIDKEGNLDSDIFFFDLSNPCCPINHLDVLKKIKHVTLPCYNSKSKAHILKEQWKNLKRKLEYFYPNSMSAFFFLKTNKNKTGIFYLYCLDVVLRWGSYPAAFLSIGSRESGETTRSLSEDKREIGGKKGGGA